MKSLLNRELKLPYKMNCVQNIGYLLYEIRLGNENCDYCNQKILSVPYISKSTKAHRLYHIKCAYNMNLLTDRQFIIINKLPIVELKIELLQVEVSTTQSQTKIQLSED